MKYAIIFLLFTVLKCEVTDKMFCGFETSDSLDFYSKDFIGIVPSDCSLDMSNMNIFDVSSIDNEFITKIKLAAFSLPEVKKVIAHFGELRSLNISQSNYKTLSPLKHESLQKLNVSQNELTEIPVGFFRDMPVLREVDFSYNKLIKIRSASFESVTKLRRMDVSNNNISSIERNTFPQIKNLEFINLSENSILQLANEFDESINLKIVRIEHNRSTWREWSTFLSLVSRGVSLYLSWENTVQLPIWHIDNNFIAVTNGQYEGVFPTANGSIELHCKEQSFKMLKLFRIKSNQLVNPMEI